MKIEYDKKFLKDLEKINDKAVRVEINSFISLIKASDDIRSIPKVKKLTSHKSAYRYRIGNYKVGFYYENSHIILRKVAHRRDFYKQFPFLII